MKKHTARLLAFALILGGFALGLASGPMLLGRLLYLPERRALRGASAVVGGLVTDDPSPEYRAGVAAAVAEINGLALSQGEKGVLEEAAPPTE